MNLLPASVCSAQVCWFKNHSSLHHATFFFNSTITRFSIEPPPRQQQFHERHHYYSTHFCKKKLPNPIAKRETQKDGTRYYHLHSGHVFPSVTTVLNVISKPMLATWMKKGIRKLNTQSMVLLPV